jgi:hypothetical protein
MNKIPILVKIFKLEKKGNLREAIKYLKIALSQNLGESTTLDCIKHLANNYYLVGEYDESTEYATQYLKFKEDFKLRNLLGINKLNKGDISGFKEYDYRWYTSEPAFDQYTGMHRAIAYLKSWDQLKDKRVFVIGEQGFGDDLMFSHVYKYLPEAGCKRIFIYSRGELGLLFRHNYPPEFEMYIEDELNYDNSDVYLQEHYDYVTSTGDLFCMYVEKFGKFPELSKYTGDVPAEIQFSKRPNIAFVYSTSGKGNAHKERLVPISAFKKFLDVYEMYNFQMGGKEKIGTDVTKGITCFLDTASYLGPMDGVITVDTAFAHLALALDKPTVLLYDRYLDWRFKIGIYKKPLVVSTRDPELKRKVMEFFNDRNKEL